MSAILQACKSASVSKRQPGLCHDNCKVNDFVKTLSNEKSNK